MTRLVVITGPDGSGKSTLAQTLVDSAKPHRPHQRIQIASIWDAMQTTDQFKSRGEVLRHLKSLSDKNRTSFLFTAMARSLELALNSEPHTVIIDGYWYKYAVTEMGYGVDCKWVLNIAERTFTRFPNPDSIFFLDVSPSDAWARKKEVSLYERGPATDSLDARDEFIRFQARLEPFWQLVKEQSATPWRHVKNMTEVCVGSDDVKN